MLKYPFLLALVGMVAASAQAELGVVAPTSPRKPRIVDVTVPGTGKSTPSETTQTQTKQTQVTSDEDEVITVDTKLKVVPVVARKGRKGVEELRVENFEVFGKDGAVEIAFFNGRSEEWRLDVEVIADLSGSLEKEEAEVRRAIEEIRAQLDPKKDTIRLRSFGQGGSPVLANLRPGPKTNLAPYTPKLRTRKDGQSSDITATSDDLGFTPIKHVQIFLSDFADNDISDKKGNDVPGRKGNYQYDVCSSRCMNRYISELRRKMMDYDEGEVAFYPLIVKNEFHAEYTKETGNSLIEGVSNLSEASGGVTFVAGSGQIDVRKIFEYVREDLKATYFVGFYVDSEKDRFSVRYRKASSGDPDPKKIRFR